MQVTTAAREMSDVTEAAEAARQLAVELAADVEQAKTREEHIRVTARANEAARIAYMLQHLLPA